ncbi:hypothetical protein Btru_066576 [Bulinus truncatus]|nr:hypothetical protein Btru_066576 [Bulinus truncatus]
MYKYVTSHQFISPRAPSNRYTDKTSARSDTPQSRPCHLKSSPPRHSNSLAPSCLIATVDATVSTQADTHNIQPIYGLFQFKWQKKLNKPEDKKNSHFNQGNLPRTHDRRVISLQVTLTPSNQRGTF